MGHWPVAIVGAGPVGLCAALRLHHLGVKSILLEQSSAPATDLRASTFHPPSLDMLEELDLAAPLLDGGLKVPHWQVRLHATHERAVFDLGVLAEDTRHPYRLQFEQAGFCAIALRRAGESDSISLCTGSAVTRVTQQDETVRLDIPDGRSVTADYVIAADGASSTLRTLLELPFNGLTYPEDDHPGHDPVPFRAASARPFLGELRVEQHRHICCCACPTAGG